MSLSAHAHFWPFALVPLNSCGFMSVPVTTRFILWFPNAFAQHMTTRHFLDDISLVHAFI
jgi:hypothetical protein